MDGRGGMMGPGHEQPRSINAGSGDHLARTLRRLHHGGTPGGEPGTELHNQITEDKAAEARERPERYRPVDQGAVEVFKGGEWS